MMNPFSVQQWTKSSIPKGKKRKSKGKSNNDKRARRLDSTTERDPMQI